MIQDETRIPNFSLYEGQDKKWLFDNNYDVVWYAKSIDTSKPINEGIVYSFYDNEECFTFCLPSDIDTEESVMNEQKDFEFEEFIIDLNLYG
jgi:hypothetical protein